MKKPLRRIWIYILSGILLIGLFLVLKARHDEKELREYIELNQSSVLYGPPTVDTISKKLDSLSREIDQQQIDSLRERLRQKMGQGIIHE